MPYSIDVRQKQPPIPAMKRGFAGKCPNCGNGRIFGAFLKVRDECANCGTEFHHHRADDFPPYLVIVIVGHIIVSLAVLVETQWEPSTTTHMLLWLPLTIILALALLQPVKGAIVALQWALKMHGFSGEEDTAEDSV